MQKDILWLCLREPEVTDNQNKAINTITLEVADTFPTTWEKMRQTYPAQTSAWEDEYREIVRKAAKKIRKAFKECFADVDMTVRIVNHGNRLKVRPLSGYLFTIELSDDLVLKYQDELDENGLDKNGDYNPDYVDPAQQALYDVETEIEDILRDITPKEMEELGSEFALTKVISRCFPELKDKQSVYDRLLDEISNIIRKKLTPFKYKYFPKAICLSLIDEVHLSVEDEEGD